MESNAILTADYLSVISDLRGDRDGRTRAKDHMEHSTAISHGRPAAASFIPKLFNDSSYELLKYSAEAMYRILCKVVRRYLADPDYQQLFRLDARLRELICLPRDYSEPLPFMRLDALLNEDDSTLRFCEFNGDGSTGMNEDREIGIAVADTATFRAFAHDHHVRSNDLFESWVQAFDDTYRSYRYRVENPHIVIADYLERGVVSEFEVYAEQFRKNGINCSIADVRELSFDGRALHDGQGRIVHGLWRRAVTNDVLRFWEESQGLIEAARAHKVALIGSFAGHLVHDKQLFGVLRLPQTLQFLTDEERSFVVNAIPKTEFLSSSAIDRATLLEQKAQLVIKPTDGYGAEEVFIGREMTDEAWRQTIDGRLDGRAGRLFLVQEYLEPYRTAVLPLSDVDEDASVRLFNNLSGLYVYNGRFQGVFSRLGPRPIICEPCGGLTAATFWVDLDQSTTTFPPMHPYDPAIKE